MLATIVTQRAPHLGGDLAVYIIRWFPHREVYNGTDKIIPRSLTERFGISDSSWVYGLKRFMSTRNPLANTLLYMDGTFLRCAFFFW